VYLGDSTSRFEYLALAAAVHNAKPANRRPLHTRPARGAAGGGTCEASEGTWVSNFERWSDGFGGRELCDCFRLRPRQRDCCDQSVENRVYYGAHGVRLAFVQWFGHFHAPRGSLDLARALAAREPTRARKELSCANGYGRVNGWSWSRPLEHVLRVLAAARPTAVIVNAGHWGVSKLSVADWQRIGAAGAELIGAGNTSVYWRTTPFREDAHGHVDRADQTPWAARDLVDPAPLLAAGWQVYDAAALVAAVRRRNPWSGRPTAEAALFKDGVHLSDDLDRVLADHVLGRILRC